jgi:hypothetical protein
VDDGTEMADLDPFLSISEEGGCISDAEQDQLQQLDDNSLSPDLNSTTHLIEASTL